MSDGRIRVRKGTHSHVPNDDSRKGRVRGLLAVLYINHTDRMDTVDGADNVIVLIFWPLLVVTRIGIACYRIIGRLLK